MASKYLIKNMGSLDRALRAFVIAPVAIVLAFALGAASIAGIVLFVVAGVALATGAIGSCPSYVPFGIDTHGRGRAHAPLPH
jgi:Inner membrane protein YgaP-like, transmembrane domain